MGLSPVLGVFLTAVDLALLAWAILAIGLYLAIKPGPTNVASTRNATITPILLLVHAGLLAGITRLTIRAGRVRRLGR